MTETIEECNMIGLCIRFGANINRFYNDKNIIWYVIEKFKKRRELFFFVVCMLLISGLSYNDYMFKDSSVLIHSYFKQQDIQMFFPHNIVMENQKQMNLFLDSVLNKEQFYYSELELVENMDVKLIRLQLTKKHTLNCEDVLLTKIIDAGNLNMFIAAIESSYMISYFGMERLRLKILNTTNHIIRTQLIEMVYFLNLRNIFFDEIQYDSISTIIPDVNFSEIIINNPDKPLFWEYISQHPSLTIEMINNNPDKPWDWGYISDNELMADKNNFIEKQARIYMIVYKMKKIWLDKYYSPTTEVGKRRLIRSYNELNIN